MMIKDGIVENIYFRKVREEDEWNRMVNGCVKNLELYKILFVKD